MSLQSKDVLNTEGKQYHICCNKGDIGKYVFLPGDPFRTDFIAEKLKNPKIVAHNREHKTWTGTLNGELVSVTSTGMGSPSTAIAVEELIHCGAEVLIRIGTCGRVCQESYDEDLEGLIVTAAVRDEGTTLHYVPVEYPAVADRTVVEALSRAAKTRGCIFAEGITQTKDAFYGQHDPQSLPNSGRLLQRWEAWEKSGVMATEMESSALFVVSSIRGVKAGTILAYGSMTNNTIEIACDAVKFLIQSAKENIN